MNLGSDLLAARFLKQQNCNRISLLAGGAAANPDADGVGSFLVREQARDNERRELLERACIAKKHGHRDEKISE